MLFATGVEIEQLHDQEMYEMIEKGMRVGMCEVCHYGEPKSQLKTHSPKSQLTRTCEDILDAGARGEGCKQII